MAGRGPAPKADADRRRQNAPTFSWTTLPKAGRKGPTPKLPSARKWSPTTVAAWRDLWRSPQAVMWDPSGRTLWRWAALLEDLLKGERATAGISAEMRQIEDRHGLSPKALLELRWRIGEVGEEPAAGPAKPTGGRAAGRSRGDVLQLLRGDGA